MGIDKTDVLFGVESLLGLLTLALERLYAICWPIKHRTIKRQHLLLLICVTWFVAMVTGCTSLIKQKKSVFFYFIIPLLSVIHIFICTSYTVIWLKVRASPSVGENANTGRSGKERKLAQTLFIVTVLSILAWLPSEVLNILLPFCVPCQKTLRQFTFLAKLLQFGNSLINPIIYALRIPEFRKCSRRLYSRRFSSRTRSSRSSRKNRSTMIALQ